MSPLGACRPREVGDLRLGIGSRWIAGGARDAVELTSRCYTHTGLEGMRKALATLDEAGGEGTSYVWFWF
jgi:hypothetical protein